MVGLGVLGNTVFCLKKPVVWTLDPKKSLIGIGVTGPWTHGGGLNLHSRGVFYGPQNSYWIDPNHSL